MAEVPSTFQLHEGAVAPDFSLWRPSDGSQVALADVAQNLPMLVVFACNHCPFVIHLAEVLGKMAREYRGLVSFVAINSNDVEKYPADSPTEMVSFQAMYGWDFDYLYDESQQVAKAYGAACTPDFFLFDGQKRLVWAGQFDETRPRGAQQGTATGEDLRAALDALLADRTIAQPWRPATGCNIKWKAGNEPNYF